MLKAVIFDFDGVVADSELLHYQALNEAFKEYGIDVPKEVHWDKYLGYSDYENVEAVDRDYNANFTPEQVEQIVARKTVVFDEIAKTDAAIIDGVVGFVRMLHNNDIPTPVCSGATLNDILLMLNGTPLAGAFGPIVTADDVKKGKPDPEGFRLALKRLNQTLTDPIVASECVVIEDSHWGLQAAGAAGMHKVAVTNTYSAEEVQPYAELVVDRLDKITMDDLNGLCR